MSVQCLLRARSPRAAVTVRLRFLQLQARQAQRLDGAGQYRTVEALTVAGRSVLSWDEAVEREISLPALELSELSEAHDYPLEFPGGEDVEPVTDTAGRPVGRIAASPLAVDGPGPGRHRGRRRLLPAERAGRQRASRAGQRQGRRDPGVADRRAPAAAGRRCRVQLAARSARGGRRGGRTVPPAAMLSGAGRGTRFHRRDARRSDHPVRLPADRRAEPGRAVRRHRDRRDPHAAGADHDRAGEGGGPGHRPAGPRHHRPVRGFVTGRHAAVARHPARSGRCRAGTGRPAQCRSGELRHRRRAVVGPGRRRRSPSPRWTR